MRGINYVTVYTDHQGTAKVSFSGLDQPDSILIALDNGVLTVKTPGHDYWSGRGMTSYAPTQYEVLEVLEIRRKNDDGSIGLKVQWITAFNTRVKDVTVPDKVETRNEYIDRSVFHEGDDQ